MAQDLKELFEKERKTAKGNMPHGHEARFEKHLEEAFPRKKDHGLPLLWIAAVITLLLFTTVGYLVLRNGDNINLTNMVDTQEEIQNTPAVTLGQLSPDLKKVENYYVNSINYELSLLEVNDDNKGLIDTYLKKLAQLDEEYKVLSEELNTMGPNDYTINALITNLQLKLQLLQQLKEKLRELKASKDEKSQLQHQA